MATITPLQSARPTEPPIRASLDIRHIPQASRTTHNHLQDLLPLNIVWASQQSISNTKILLNTAAATNFQVKTLVVAVWAVKSMDSAIYIYTVLLPLPTKAPTNRRPPSLPVSSENEAYRIQVRMASVTRERPLSSNPCPHSHDILESRNKLSPREQLLSSAPIQ